MKLTDALREVKKRPWYVEDVYLTTWHELNGVRYCILTPTDIIGWGFTWEKALADADRRHESKFKFACAGCGRPINVCILGKVCHVDQ